MNPDNPVGKLVKKEGRKVQQLKLRRKKFCDNKKVGLEVNSVCAMYAFQMINQKVELEVNSPV